MIREDNPSRAEKTENLKYHDRAKQIDIELIPHSWWRRRDKVQLQYCETKAMLVDIMALALYGPRHKMITTAQNMRAYSHGESVSR